MASELKSIVNKFYGPTMEGSISGQPLYAESTVKKHELGTRWCLPDGRVFHYAMNGAVELAAGRIVQGPATPLVHATTGLAYMGPNAAAALGTTKVVMNVGTTVTTTLLPENALAGGYLMGMAGIGLGHTYRISGNTIKASSKTTLTLADPIRVALTTTASKMVMLKSLYAGVVVAPVGSGTSIAAGVPPIVVSASTATVKYYFWLQTWGPCSVFTGAIQPTVSAITGPNMTLVAPAPTTAVVGLATSGGDGAAVLRVLVTAFGATSKPYANKAEVGVSMMAVPTTTAAVATAAFIPVFLRIAP